ncbi:MAG: sigma-70 family RNA polymerase sigma factor [Cytophagales bacterium]|nr:sigma-70 family RNA polymerase sigma factor [Cytophagales bacterium]
MNQSKSDQEILRIYRKEQDSELIGVVFTRYTDLVYGLCLKYLKDRAESQDAVMNIFEKLIEKLKTEEVQHFKSWLYMVSKNHCLMILRKNNPETRNDFMEISIAAHPIDESEDMESDLNALEDCISTLKKDQEACVRLFYLRKMSYQQVCEETKFDLKSVKSFIQNGKRNLKICLEGKNVKG